MDPRNAFLKSASTLIQGFTQLAQYRLFGNTAKICVLDVHDPNSNLYSSVELPVVRELKAVSAFEFVSFDTIFQESSMVMAFSWLESFLGEVEEALYLQNPAHLGEQVQVKLGKILDVGSIEDLLHDIVRRRVRDRSQWSLPSRFSDLTERHGFLFKSSAEDIEWMSTTRNKIIHDRKYGYFQVKRRKVSYELARRQSPISRTSVERFLRIASNSVVDLYENSCRILRVTSRNVHHRAITNLIVSWRELWPSSGSSTDP